MGEDAVEGTLMERAGSLEGKSKGNGEGGTRGRRTDQSAEASEQGAFDSIPALLFLLLLLCHLHCSSTASSAIPRRPPDTHHLARLPCSLPLIMILDAFHPICKGPTSLPIDAALTHNTPASDTNARPVETCISRK